MKEYKQNNLIITWEKEKCTHSAKCVKGLGQVFKPKEQPWIKTGVATDEEIMNQIDQCPSKALGYRVEE
jgi:uncharacterized Fe-S cluster protein YjdI